MKTLMQALGVAVIILGWGMVSDCFRQIINIYDATTPIFPLIVVGIATIVFALATTFAGVSVIKNAYLLQKEKSKCASQK